MIPFDDNTMMVMLELPACPSMGGNRHIEKGPMEGMQSESDELLRKIYCMLKEHFKDECDTDTEEDDYELQGCIEEG